MAWGYESSFIVEHDQTLRKNINCKDCVYYETDDKTCRKRPLYLPHDGYNSWKHCKYFELDKGAINYIDKKEKYASVLRRKEVIRNQENKANNKQVAPKKDFHDSVTKTSSTCKTSGSSRNYRLIVYTDDRPKKKLRNESIVITPKSGIAKKVSLLFDDSEKKIYINGRSYKQEIIDKIRSMLRER